MLSQMKIETGKHAPHVFLSTTAVTDCLMLRIDRKAMNLALAQDATLSALFTGYLLERNLRHQEDLADQLINPSEKRLARLLMLLAEFDGTENIIPKVSQVTLAEMVGTTRSRVSFFLNRFRKLGFIQYKYNARDVLRVNSERLDLVLRDESAAGREKARVGGNVQSITANRAKRQTEAAGLKNRRARSEERRVGKECRSRWS